MNSSQQQKAFEASCGAEIPKETSKIRGLWPKKVWQASGEIMNKFDNEVMPEIGALLQNEGPRGADYYISAVMVGMRKASAKPKILVSCTNPGVRAEVLKIIKGSLHIRNAYPEFGFGESNVPLHEPVPSVPLAGHMMLDSRESPQDIPASIGGPSANNSSSGEVRAFDRNPSAGRKLVLRTDNGTDRYSTGGIVVRIGDNYYQKTVAHIGEAESNTTPQSEIADVGYCRFDDDSDEDDDVPRFECDLTGRGSITPENNQSSESINRTEIPLNLESVGRLLHDVQTSKKPGLDYALVLLDLDISVDLQKANWIRLESSRDTHLQIGGVKAVPAEEREVITATASGGVTHGKLSPNAVYFYNHQQNSLQKMYIVYLSTVVVDGDCGADVIDKETGSLYGHIVRGCRGTRIAYLISAKEVFEDIQEWFGIMPEILSNDQLGIALPSDPHMMDIDTKEDETQLSLNKLGPAPPIINASLRNHQSEDSKSPKQLLPAHEEIMSRSDSEDEYQDSRWDEDSRRDRDHQYDAHNASRDSKGKEPLLRHHAEEQSNSSRTPHRKHHSSQKSKESSSSSKTASSSKSSSSSRLAPSSKSTSSSKTSRSRPVNDANPYTGFGTLDSIYSPGINWGSWRQLPNGLWHREGQDSSGNWYEEDQHENPMVPRQLPPVHEDIPFEDPSEVDDTTHHTSSISWGSWRRLPNGQWYREGQNLSGSWYEDYQDEDPRPSTNWVE